MDALLAALAASAMLWAKRGDVVEHQVFKLVQLSSGSSTTASKVALEVSRHFRTPSFLLRGFDLVGNGPQLPHRRMRANTSGESLLSHSERKEFSQRGPAELVTAFRWLEEQRQWQAAVKLFEWHSRKSMEDVQPVVPEALSITVSVLCEHERTALAMQLIDVYGFPSEATDSVLCKLLEGECTEAQLDLIFGGVAIRNPMSAELAARLLNAAAAAQSWSVAKRVLHKIRSGMGVADAHSIRNAFHVCFRLACESGCVADASEVLSLVKSESPAAVSEVLLYALHTPVGGKLAYEEVQLSTDSSATWEVALALFANNRTVSSVAALTSILPESASEHISQAVLSVDSRHNCFSEVVTAAEERGSWLFALSIASALQKRPCTSSWTSLCIPLLSNQRWSDALFVLTSAAVQRRNGLLSEDEYSAAAYASFAAGKGKSGIFWLERAHSQHFALRASIYDAAIRSVAERSWEAALTVFCKAKLAGGSCSEEGIRSILSAAERDHTTRQALDVIWLSDSVKIVS